MNKFLITHCPPCHSEIYPMGTCTSKNKRTLFLRIFPSQRRTFPMDDVGVNVWISGWNGNDCTFYEYSWGHLSHPITMVGLNIVRVYQKDTAFPWTNGCIHFPVALYLIDKHENFLWIFANGCGKFMECIQFYQVLSESFEKLWLKPL